MKKLIIFALLVLPLLGLTQNKILNRELFTYSNKGLEPSSLNVFTDSMTKEDLYAKARAWIDIANASINGCTLKILSKTPNEGLIIRGKLPYYLCEVTKALKFKCFNTKFTIDLLFFDGGYTISPTSLKYEANNNTLWLPIQIHKRSKTIYKSDGTVRKSFIHFPSTIKTLFNVIDISLYSYIINNETLKIEMY
jgi:hypothetical protein